MSFFESLSISIHTRTSACARTVPACLIGSAPCSSDSNSQNGAPWHIETVEKHPRCSSADSSPSAWTMTAASHLPPTSSAPMPRVPQAELRDEPAGRAQDPAVQARVGQPVKGS
eukprot:365224-Chlamydomonas_euryale.AAC.10